MNTHWKPCIEVWMSYYRQKTSHNYCFSPIDARHLKELLKKVKQKISDREMEENDENIINSLSGFLHSITDKWILEHLELKNVNSNFNTLYVSAFNKNPFARSQSIADKIKAQHGGDSQRAAG